MTSPKTKSFLEETNELFDEKFSRNAETGQIFMPGWGAEATLEDIKAFHTARIRELVRVILPDLHRLRANIPLTDGENARKRAKELIDKLDALLGKENK